MNKNLWLIPLAIMAVSCSLEKIDAPDVDNDVIVYARIEETDTKVFADENLKVLWNADDRISLFNKYTFNKQYKFTGNTGDNAGEFEEVSSSVVTGNALENVYSVYPYMESTSISNSGVLSVNIPSEQKYRKDSFGLGANVMVSATTNTDLLFKNIGGYLILKLYGEGVSVSSVTLRGNGEEVLAGPATISANVGTLPQLVFEASGTAKSITLNCETPVALGATAEEATSFWIVVPPITFSKGFTINVTGKNGSTFEKSTSSEVVIPRNSTYRMKALEVEIDDQGPVAVDLGLSVKWATFNLGATQPEDYGDYFAWGETKPYYFYNDDHTINFSLHQQGYEWGSYQWISLGKEYTFIKRYCPSTLPYGYKWSGSDNPDDKTQFLDYNYVDDAARANWNGEWRIPTEAEWSELVNNCSWEWIDDYNETGVKGYLVTGTKPGYTSQSIFLPAAGYYNKTLLIYQNMYGSYWSSSLYIDRPDNARYLGFRPGDDIYMQNTVRPSGQSVRPVTE